jgi:squalene-hopene/tetraprenyl-beta-curcumene cyclase
VRASIALTLALSGTAFAGDWNARLAADYLDARQKQWFEWPSAKATGGVCMSCHTGATYLLARPALRKTLGETAPASWETGLLDSMRARVAIREPGKIKAGETEPNSSRELGVESVFAALFLARAGDGRAMTEEAREAFDRLWALQIREGKDRGAWKWFTFDLDPWETPESQYYGAAMAALAVGSAPESYRERPEVKERIAALADYLARERSAQPLHNRLALAWASSKLPSALDKPLRRAIVEEAIGKQRPDGGWTLESLGPWKAHEKAPPSAGSNAYATAFAAYTLEQAGVKRSQAPLRKAHAWLRARQDRGTGAWAADSMNKVYKSGSIPEGFMRDAATAFAVMVLAGK